MPFLGRFLGQHWRQKWSIPHLLYDQLLSMHQGNEKHACPNAVPHEAVHSGLKNPLGQDSISTQNIKFRIEQVP